MYIEFIISIIATFILTACISKWLIPILKSKKMGQIIKDIGPRWHKSKEGTPTMGGIAFIGAILLVSTVTLIVNGREAVPLLLALGLGVLNALIGFIDDYRKLIKKDNEGLLAKEKYLLQLVVSALYLFVLKITGNLSTVIDIPFADISIDLGILYYVFALILITGIVNSVNLTDGIDGLASSVTLVVGAFFALCAFRYGFRSLEVLSGTLIGGMLGFLVYNFHPARVFMGDTGSLFIGGLVTGMAFLMDKPLIIVICGLVYVIEALSDIIQVGVFKLSGRKKRVFKMAPIHHHFEKCGWGEIKIVAVFSIASVIFSVIAWLAL